VRFPLSMTAGIAGYIFKNRLWPRPEWQRDPLPKNGNDNPFHILHTKGNNGTARHPLIHQRFPLVLMLEPLHACNLTCEGCGRIREYEDTITQRLSIEQCLKAVDECGAPVVSICGGEPLLYQEVGPLTSAILDRGRHIYLCTNGLLVRKRLGEFTPHDHLFINIHLDGLEKTHDKVVEREGVFREAIEAIRAAKAAGFKVCTNTTVYKETEMKEIESLFEYLEQFAVDGHMLSPGYGYSSVDDQEIFLTRDDVREKFADIERLEARYKLNNSPLYFDFLKGGRALPCTAWANPTYNIKGWKGPCYLITDAHYETFEELMNQTPWESYGHGNDPRCEHCMTHCGFEPSAALGINSKFSDNLKLAVWALR